MTTTSKLLPGMVNNSVEFFVQAGELKFIHSGTVNGITDLPFSVIQILEETIRKDKAVKAELHKWHPNSKYKRLEQFITCRFGGLDHTPDISNGKVQDGEYWDCPLRGQCASEGILCKLPVHEGKRLTNLEVKIMQLSATDKTNEVIADELGLAFGTFHKIKKGIHAVFGQTKQQIALWASYHNLI